MTILSSLLALPTSLSLLSYTTAFHPTPPPPPPPKPLPLLIWHGLGDRYDAAGLQSIGDLVHEIHPETRIHYIHLDAAGDQDRTATFLGNVTGQLELVCTSLSRDAPLSHARDSEGRLRVDALGFSQGGQFLRGLVQRCDGVRVRSLVTFGAQHNGITGIKACGRWDWVCRGAVAVMQRNVWSDYVQGHVVPAQYYRSLNESTGEVVEEYLAHSNFLADVNNERPGKNRTYAERLAELDKFVMFVFEDDTTVIPKESGWFAEVNATNGMVQPLREREMYKDDWLGLRKLDEKGGLVFKTTPGDHMQLEDEILKDTIKEYFGPERVAEAFHVQAADLWDDVSVIRQDL